MTCAELAAELLSHAERCRLVACIVFIGQGCPYTVGLSVAHVMCSLKQTIAPVAVDAGFEESL